MAVTWTSKITDVANNQIPFAIAGTLNLLAQSAAVEAREAAAAGMNVKNKTLLKFFIRAPAESKATKTRLKARVVVKSPKSSKSDRGNILTQQEEWGSKLPLSGRSVAMPSRDIRKPGSKREIIRGTELKNFRPFRTQSFIDSRQTVAVGAKNSFFVTLKKGRAAGKKMLLQRFGRGGKSVRGLWLFVPQTRLTPKLRFNKTVRNHVQKNIAAAFKRSFSQALASARPLKGATQSSRI